MNQKVPCEYEGCPARVDLNYFDEMVWLPVFKSTRQHLGFFCPDHARQARAGQLGERYLVSRVESGEEIVIDRQPLVPEKDSGKPPGN